MKALLYLIIIFHKSSYYSEPSNKNDQIFTKVRVFFIEFAWQVKFN